MLIYLTYKFFLLKPVHFSTATPTSTTAMLLKLINISLEIEGRSKVSSYIASTFFLHANFCHLAKK